MLTNQHLSMDNAETQTSEDGVNLTTSDLLNLDSTEQTKNGWPKLLTVKEKTKAFADMLELYCSEHGLPSSLPCVDSEYINILENDFSNYSIEELYEIQLKIHQQIYRIQTAYNQKSAIAERLAYEINRIIVPILDHYQDIFKHEDRKMAAIFENDAARKYYEMETNCKAAIKRMSGLIDRLDNICKILDKMTWRKQSAEK